MAEPESVPSDAPATADCAVPSAIAGKTPAPTTPYEPDDAHAGVPGFAGRVTETGVPAADETDVEPSAHLPQIPGYQILRTIGGGGMGTVFKAVHLGLNRVVALKLINAGWVADDDFRARFDREAKTLAALDHANIVPVFDAGTWQGLPYLTMKFIAGKTLYHRLEVVRRDPRAAARLMAQVARAVQYLHSRGIIHRDLKPLNILLTADGTPLVADFGLARPLADDSAMSMTLVPLGTRQYMSPEQSRGGRENYTPACDIWALGVILYELLAGHRPFAHDDPLELFRRIRFEPTPPVPADRSAPPELEAIARKCLEKFPADRYPTAEAVAADLEHWLAGEPISLPLPSVASAEAPVEPPRATQAKKSRRSRVLLAGLAAAIVCVVAAAVAGAGAFRDRHPKEQPPVEPPAPQVAKRTALERFAAGESIALTDDRGRPVGPVHPVPGHDVGTRERGDRFEFFSTKPGVVALSEESFPLPLRVTGSIAVTNGSEPDSLLAVSVARRRWEGGNVPHESFVWFGLKPALDGTGPQTSCVGHYWWWQNDPKGSLRWEDKPVPRNPAAGRAGVPVEIVVHEEHVTGRVGGVELIPITAKMATARLYLRIRDNPEAGPYKFTPPIFGSGVGLFVRNADGVVSDLRVSKFKP